MMEETIALTTRVQHLMSTAGVVNDVVSPCESVPFFVSRQYCGLRRKKSLDMQLSLLSET